MEIYFWGDCTFNSVNLRNIIDRISFEKVDVSCKLKKIGVADGTCMYDASSIEHVQ